MKTCLLILTLVTGLAAGALAQPPPPPGGGTPPAVPVIPVPGSDTLKPTMPPGNPPPGVSTNSIQPANTNTSNGTGAPVGNGMTNGTYANPYANYTNPYYTYANTNVAYTNRHHWWSW